MIVPLFVGRNKSIKAEIAMSENKDITYTQKVAKVEDPNLKIFIQ